jgi:hypothetical protein
MDFIRSEYDSKNEEIEKYLFDIKNIVSKTNTLLEGNCFYHNLTFEIYPELYSKQLNLFWCGKYATNKICEIGFNAGHSSLLMLLGNKDNIQYTVFDIGHHDYTRPALEYIQSKFQNVRFEYVEGDSTITLPLWINIHKDEMYTYDVVHVDGGHSELCISHDIRNADLLVRQNGIIIIDDTNDEIINKYVDLYLSTGNYIEMDILKTYGYPHRIIKKVIK